MKAFLEQQEQILPIPEEVSQEALYKLCQMHNVTAIAYDSLRRSDTQEEALLKYRDAMVGAVYRNAILDEMISEVTDAFENAGIPYTILKGYRLKEDYPVPELRTMGDVDFLVKEENRMEVDHLLREIGYEKEELGGSTWTYQQSGITLEIHTKLASGNYWNNVDYEEYFMEFFSRLRTTEHSCERPLSLEDHFIFLLFHLAKHLNSSGAGIRMVLDLAVYLKKYGRNMNWEFIWQEVEKIRMKRFTEHILCFCERLFDVELPFELQTADEDLINQLFSYIIKGGIFGFERPDSIRRLRQGIGNKKQAGNRRIQVAAAMKLAFPGRKHMAAFMPAVEKHVWLLPVAWIKRWKMGMKYKDRVEASLSGFNENVDEAREQYRLLKKIGL